MSKAMAEVLEILDVARIGEDEFSGVSPSFSWARVFGGQVIAQAVVAAQRTVAADRPIHSLHAYFIRGGDPAVPINYRVERLRDGGSFSVRSVVARQHGEAIFSMNASFQRPEPGFEHFAPPPPDVPPPAALLGEKELMATFRDAVPEGIRSYWSRERAIEMKPVSLTHFLSRAKLPPRQNVWVRTSAPVPDDPAMAAAMLAYLSDMTLLDTALHPHGASLFDRDIQVASLDHAMWFHRPHALDGWLLYAQDSPNAVGGRGLSRGGLYGEDGRLVASVAQEGLIRRRTR